MRRRSGVWQTSASVSIVFGSSMSRRWAMCDMVRWCATRKTTLSASSAGRPMRAVSASISGMPLATWPWPLPLPMSCSSMPSISRPGRSSSLTTCALPSESGDWPGASASRFCTAISECWSAVNLW